MTQADILSLEGAALKRFTNARREGTLDLSPEVESMLDSMGVWWDEIEQECQHTEHHGKWHPQHAENNTDENSGH